MQYQVTNFSIKIGITESNRMEMLKVKKKKFKNVFDKYIIKFNTVNKDLEKLKTDQ